MDKYSKKKKKKTLYVKVVGYESEISNQSKIIKDFASMFLYIKTFLECSTCMKNSSKRL